MAYPCFYYEMKKPYKTHHHRRDVHDHFGWPSPRHPDHICQDWELAREICCNPRDRLPHYDPWHQHSPCRNLLDMANLIPIHFNEEGYNTASFVTLVPVPGLVADASIDLRDDWVVRIKLEIAAIEFVEEKFETKYAVRVLSPAYPNSGLNERNDLLAHGRLIILPAAL